MNIDRLTDTTEKSPRRGRIAGALGGAALLITGGGVLASQTEELGSTVEFIQPGGTAIETVRDGAFDIADELDIDHHSIRGITRAGHSLHQELSGENAHIQPYQSAEITLSKNVLGRIKVDAEPYTVESND